MRIISKFRDYYDGVSAYGASNAYYNRKSVISPLELKNFPSGHVSFSGKEFVISEAGVIGFCGSFFPYLKIYRSFYDGRFYASEEKILYSDAGLQSKYWLSVSIYDFFRPRTGSDDKFHELGVPVFVNRRTSRWGCGGERVLNPRLEDYDFYTQVDPFTAFTMIDSYISGVLGVGVPETVEISDQSMRDKKGFDKWSFKNKP